MERTDPTLLVSLENDYYQTVMIDTCFKKENIWLKVNL